MEVRLFARPGSGLASCTGMPLGDERQRLGMAALRTGSEAAVMAKKISTMVHFIRLG